MKSNQVFYIALSLLLLGSLLPNEVESLKVDLNRLSECTESGLKVAATLISRAIPCVKKLAKCADFRAIKTKDLDITGLALLGYQYLQKVVNNQRCLLITLKESYDAVSPYIDKLISENCVPGLS
uniref:Acp53C14c n=1 Tax=Drosophila simulans TaxID=7240 RepID=A0A0A7KX34_DROSI|nr:Acp53C14c [Drosophila simulans]AIZ50493.1 Acp53C14c [Drosophila simulans]AIZ50495.1 Acp53C14c [Drosophila simulans]AIZ50497.1 Acp53C14c [Drosophila simulans]